MSNFPALNTQDALHHQSVKGAEDSVAASFQVIQGFDASFHPAGLPSPSWFIAVNPNGFDDPERIEVNLNECFEPGNQDAELLRVSGVSIEAARQALWSSAQTDAEDHVQCDNGGLYAIWALSNDELVLGGFDNGGSCIASYLHELAQSLGGQVVVAGGASHFDPQDLLTTEYPHQLSQEERNMGLLSQLLCDQVPAPSPRPHL